MGNTHSAGQWYHRDLPHYDAHNQYQMITYRLADSLAQSYLRQLQEEKDCSYRRRIEAHLDRSLGSCLLRREEFASIVISSWEYWHKKRYDLIAYVIMPNHVHLLVRIYEGESLSTILHSWKSWTSHEIHQKQRALNEEDKIFTPLWQRECWDRYIRHEQHFIDAVNYIHLNPVKAGLITRPEDWQWSSAKIFS